MLADFWQDLRYGARMLVKNAGFSLIAIIMLENKERRPSGRLHHSGHRHRQLL